MSAREEFVTELEAMIGPLLDQKRAKGTSYHQRLYEAADALIPYVVAVRDGTLAEAARVVKESSSLAEAEARISHRRSR